MEQNFELVLEQLIANQLLELDLSYKNLTGAQIIRLAEILKQNQSLQALSLMGNRCVAVEMEKLSEALRANQTLTMLDLSRIELNAVEAKSLCDALKVNRTLTTLYLSYNQLDLAGALMLSEVLKVNRTIAILHLSYNYIGVAGALMLIEALKVNQTLTTLNLYNNQLNNATEQEIEEALQTNIDRIRSTRNLTLLTLVILLRHAHSLQSVLPLELWEIIIQQLDFPSVKRGYRTSHAIASFLSQRNIFAEFNQRLQTQQSIFLIETHGFKFSESRFSFLTSPATILSDAANTILPASHENTETQTTFTNK